MNKEDRSIEEKIEQKEAADRLRACPCEATAALFKEKIKNLDLKDLQSLYTIIKNQMEKIYREENLQIMKENDQAYSGKTYRRANRYYKVISGYSKYKNKVECLIFDKKPILKKEENFNLLTGYLNSFSWYFSDLHIEDIMISNLKFYDEITIEEWEEAFDYYCKKIKNLKEVKKE